MEATAHTFDIYSSMLTKAMQTKYDCVQSLRLGSATRRSLLGISKYSILITALLLSERGQAVLSYC